MSRLRQTEFLAFLQKHRRGLVLIIEDRVGKGYKEYGIENHAEFINFTNPHDDCLWDAIIPGYDYKIEPETQIQIKNNVSWFFFYFIFFY